MNPPDHLSHFVVRRRRNRARVQHHQIRITHGGGRCQTFTGKARLQRGAVGLRRAASEILDEKTLHFV